MVLKTYENPHFNIVYTVQRIGIILYNQIYMQQNVYRSDVNKSPTCFGNFTGAIFRKATQQVK
jgi:hypothetical protein